jgi:hypothetical protein
MMIDAMDDKEKLELILRGLKNGSIDMGEAVHYIFRVYRNSNVFNLNSFLTGVSACWLIMFILFMLNVL